MRAAHRCGRGTSRPHLTGIDGAGERVADLAIELGRLVLGPTGRLAKAGLRCELLQIGFLFSDRAGRVFATAYPSLPELGSNSLADA